MRRARILAISLLATLALAGCASPVVGSGDAGGTRAAAPSIDARSLAPKAGLRWQIQLNGAFVETAGVSVYDLDPYQAAAETVADLRAKGRMTICHLDVGATDVTLPDASRIPASLLGADAGDGRRWIDIRQWDALEPVLADRMRLCVRKGFAAVDADATDGYANDSGFDLSADDQVTFDANVAGLAHRLGLRVAVRGRPELAARIEPHADFAVVSNCSATPDCAAYGVYVRAGKAVFDVETTPIGDICMMARAYEYAATRAGIALDGVVAPC